MLTDYNVALDCWSHAATIPNLQTWLEDFERRVRLDELNIDPVMLKEQYDILTDLLELVRDDDAFMDVTPLFGLIDLMGALLPNAFLNERGNNAG